MKALILVGGYGTRLRPLTLNFPKSVFPFINRPMVEFQIEALAKVGVKEVIIAINYKSEQIKEHLAPLEQRYNIKITYSQETEALGTAGPIKLAEKLLKADNPQGMFFCFNSDIICDFPLAELLQIHKERKGQATIVLAKVADPSRFGVVIADQKGKVSSFAQKPTVFVSDQINAGLYLLNISVIDRIPQRFCMIERETFPQLATDGQLYSLPLKQQFWFDIGKPQDYIFGQGQYLKYYKINSNEAKHDSVLIDPTAKIGPDCRIGPNVVIGPGCIIAAGCRLVNCTLIRDVKIGTGVFVNNSVISWRSKIGSWSRIEGLTVIGQDVDVQQESRVTECLILPNIKISSTKEKQSILF